MDEEFDYQKMIQIRRMQEVDKKNKYKIASKERLQKIGSKHLTTVMVNALEVIEQNFGFLWGHGENRPLTREEEHMRDIFLNKVRKDILDKGNGQIKNFVKELAQYDIEWLRYHIDLPVVSGNITGVKQDG